jgi:RNA polymerase sigma-70 factor (ECF subfamily)
MTAWRRFDQFRPGTNFRAWAFQILVNTMYRFNRRVARQREVTTGEDGFDAFEFVQREGAWSALLKDQEALAELLDERLARALERLGVEERQCLLLRLLEDFSYREISTMLQIPMGTVMSHVHRARMKLREALAAVAVEQGWAQEGV